MKKWVISDLHFDHKNIIVYSGRPYQDVEEMNVALINNWNAVVAKEDIVYFLGDFAFGHHSLERDSWWLKSLNGRKFMIIGNHDMGFKAHEYKGVGVKINTVELAIEYWTDVGFERVYDQPIVLDNFYILSHHPLDGVNHTQIFANIHGHTHDVNYSGGNYFNASVENINYTPIDFDEIEEKFKV